MNARLGCLLLALALLWSMVAPSAQEYHVDWYTIDAGGGTSARGSYELSGTVAQPDASLEALAGEDYELAGGFWPAWIPALSDEPPALIIEKSPAGVTLTWPAEAAGFRLEETSDLTSGNWRSSPVLNGVPMAPADRAIFYRLIQ